MTEHMNRKSSKKGMEVLSWVLLVGFFIMLSVIVISWTQSRTAQLTEETVKYVEGRMDCASVKITNISTDCERHEVELKNIGTLNVVKVSAQIDDTTSKLIPLDLKAQKDPQTLKIEQTFTKLKIIPIIQSQKETVGCKEKSITVRCP